MGTNPYLDENLRSQILAKQLEVNAASQAMNEALVASRGKMTPEVTALREEWQEKDTALQAWITTLSQP